MEENGLENASFTTKINYSFLGEWKILNCAHLANRDKLTSIVQKINCENCIVEDSIEEDSELNEIRETHD